MTTTKYLHSKTYSKGKTGSDIDIFLASEKLLRTMVSRLTLLSTDNNRPFINRLEALRTSIKDGLPTLQLKPLFDEISEYINRLERQEQVKVPQSLATQDYTLQLLSPMLLKMMESVKYPSAFLERLEPIKALLRNDASMNTSHNVARSLEAYFDVLADFYNAAADQELVKFKDYLYELTGQLQEVDKDVLETENLRSGSAQACEEIGEVVNSQISQLEGFAVQEPKLNDFKDCIEDRLKDIRAGVKKITRGENVRLQKAASLIKKLNNRLRKMEQEVTHLRNELEEKHKEYLSDSLTGIPNRKAYEERILHECERYCRHDTPVSMLVCDVDKFKQINDRYGHAAGDNVLKSIALVLWENIRSVDFVARYGGEEFVIIMPGATLDDAAKAAEKLRIKIQQHE
ncbi:MAG: GGDEF domain-containing protein, partial [Gammaproteobacteria bacterium]|nr:GGDEF domain-containing protein [Gammaproteobacteria bacterium]